MKEGEKNERKSGCIHMNDILRSYFFWDMFLLVYIDVIG
jgi:hypothetical protein